MYKNKPAFWIIGVAVVVCIVVAVCFLTNPKGDRYDIKELIGSGSRKAAENDSELIAPVNRSDNKALPDSRSDKVRTVTIGDIDYSGVEDYILTEERGLDDFFETDAYFKWTLVLDGEEIYTGYHGLVCDFNVCMLDLDRDLDGEIVVLVSPHVNSMPLQEYVVLKKTDSTWKELENTSKLHSKEDTYLENSFPINVTYDATSPVSMDISCDGLDYEIHADISNHYKRVIVDYESGDGSDDYVSFAKGVLEGKLYRTGDVFAQPSAWGIWSIRFDSLDGVNYLVASHGIESIEWGKQDILGYLDIWFSYDTQGKIEVFKMEYFPYTQKLIDFSDEAREIGVADDNFIRTIGEPEKIEKSFSFSKTTGKLTADVTKEAITQPVPMEVTLEDSDGKVVWKTEMGIPHLAWNSYYIYNYHGKDYLIEYNPSMSTGIVYYKFILYEFDTNGNAIIVDERYATTSESISDFNDYTKPYMDRAQLFISTIDGVITTGM